jgi:pimeloyl-ACP methyl ester carboxylesterase
MRYKLYLLLILLSISHAFSFAQNGSLQVGKLQVQYELHSEEGGAPTLLLIHGGFMNSEMWAPQEHKLSKKFRVLLIDLPGHGKTTGTDPSLKISSVIKSVLDQLKIGRINIAALSMGTIAAEEFAIAYPSMVEKLILLSPAVNGLDKIQKPDSMSMAWLPIMQAATKDNNLEKASRTFADAWAKGPSRVVGQVKGHAYQAVYDMVLDNLRNHTMSEFPVMEKEGADIAGLSTIKCPVLLVDGDKDMPYVNQAVWFLQRKIPQSQRITLKGAAHMVNLEEPEKVNDIIKDFIKD